VGKKNPENTTQRREGTFMHRLDEDAKNKSRGVRKKNVAWCKPKVGKRAGYRPTRAGGAMKGGQPETTAIRQTRGN